MNQLSAADVSRIDWDFDNDAYDCGNNSCQFDVQMVAGQTPRYYEYKSKSMSTSAESGIEINPKQFKSYLSKINSMAELQYVFIDDDLAAKFPPNERFRDVRSNGIDNDLKNICDDLENSFKLENGYRIEARKPFTFAVWTTQDFENKIKDFGYKILE